jgi:hypothetical protein
MHRVLPPAFFQRPAAKVARDLLGKHLVRMRGAMETSQRSVVGTVITDRPPAQICAGGIPEGVRGGAIVGYGAAAFCGCVAE